MSIKNDSNIYNPINNLVEEYDFFIDRSQHDTTTTTTQSVTRDWDESFIVHAVDIEPIGSMHIILNQVFKKKHITIDTSAVAFEAVNGTNSTNEKFYMEKNAVKFKVFIK